LTAENMATLSPRRRWWKALVRASSSALGQAGSLTQRPSVAIGGNRWQSVVIRRNLSHSGALSRTHVYSVALRCTQEQAGALRAVPCPLRPRPLGRHDAQGRTWRSSVDHIHRPLAACPRACRCGHDPGRDTPRAHIVIDEKTALCLQIEGPYSRYCARVWHTFWNSGVEASIDPPNQTANRCM